MLTNERRFRDWPVFGDYRFDDHSIFPVGEVVRRYNPTAAPELYVALLQTGGTPEGILNFVRTYGLNGPMDPNDPEGVLPLSQAPLEWSDSFGEWREVFKTAEKFHKFVGLVKRGKDFETGEALRPDLADAQEGAWSFVIERFSNRTLQKYCKLVLDASSGHWALRRVPYGLRGLIFEQLIDMLLENRRYETCEVCAALFVMSPRGLAGSRRNKRFCSDKCRATAGNRKKKDAQLLFERKIDPREVARQVGIPLKTAKNWARSSKGQR